MIVVHKRQAIIDSFYKLYKKKHMQKTCIFLIYNIYIIIFTIICIPLQAPKDDFAVKSLPFSEFKAYYRGKRVNNNETLDLSQVTSIGIQMYGGVYQPVKQKGPATLEIDWIRAVVWTVLLDT